MPRLPVGKGGKGYVRFRKQSRQGYAVGAPLCRNVFRFHVTAVVSAAGGRLTTIHKKNV